MGHLSVTWCRIIEGFQGAINWDPMMLRGGSLSGSCAPICCSNSSLLRNFSREKILLQKKIRANFIVNVILVNLHISTYQFVLFLSKCVWKYVRSVGLHGRLWGCNFLEPNLLQWIFCLRLRRSNLIKDMQHTQTTFNDMLVIEPFVL